ncbi:MAG: DNRLRE domain-containing protein, partial [Cohnella sp.]|nr:DNRLRE domain-containing protein [Cohnella sp.]
LQTGKPKTFDWFAHVPKSTMTLDMPMVTQSGNLGTANGYQYTQVQAKGTTTGNFQAQFTDTTDSNLHYRITMINDVTTDVYQATSFGTANEPNVTIPVLAARQTVNGKGEFLALHQFAPGADGITGAFKTDDGVKLSLADGGSYRIHYDFAHAAEETGFQLLKTDAGGKPQKLEIANDNRAAFDRKLYARSDQVLSSLSVLSNPDHTIDIANDPTDPTQKLMTAFTLYVGDETVERIQVDGEDVPFTRNADYITIHAPMKAKPTLGNNQVALHASDDAYAKEVEPNRVLGSYTTLALRNGGLTRTTMAAYVKFDLATYTGQGLADAKLRFYASDTAVPANPVKLAVYGILNNSWTEETLTWNNAPNLGKDGSGYTTITGTGTTAFYLGSISMENRNNDWQEIDVSGFVRDYGLANQKISFIVMPDKTYNDWINVSSKEGGTRGPELVVKEKQELAAAETAYVRGGAHADQHMDGSGEMEVTDAAGATDDRLAYMKFNLGAYAGTGLGKGVLSFHVSSLSASTPVAIDVYGLTDDSWNESAITWNQAPTAGGMPSGAVRIGTVYVDQANRTYLVDATAFLRSQLPDHYATIVLVNGDAANSLLRIDGRTASLSPTLSLYAPYVDSALGGAFIWGGAAHADTNYEYSTHLIVKNATGIADDRKAYLQIDLGNIRTERVNRAVLKLHGLNSTSASVAPVTLYGITDNSWEPSLITFNHAPNHNAATGEVTGVGTTAFPLDTVGIGAAVGDFEWDLSDFIYSALRADDAASLVLAIDPAMNDSYIDFNGPKGIIKPLFELDY